MKTKSPWFLPAFVAVTALPTALAAPAQAQAGGTLAAPQATMPQATTPNTTSPAATMPLTGAPLGPTAPAIGGTGTSDTVPTPPTIVPPISSLGDARERASATAPIITLEDAIALTLQNDPQRASARAALEAAQARIGIAKSAGGPQLGLGGAVALNRGISSSTSTTTTTSTSASTTTPAATGTTNNVLGFRTTEEGTVTGSLPIYTGGRVRDNTNVARFDAQAQAEIALQTEEDLVLAATNAYLTVLRNGQLLQVAVSNLAVSRERQRLTNLRYSAGAAARLDVFSANTVVANAEQLRVTASNNLAQAKANLNTLLGRTPESPLRVETITNLDLRIPLPADLTKLNASNSDTLRLLADANRPLLAESTADINSATSSLALAHDQRKPSFGASLAGLVLNPVTVLGRFGLSLGLSVAQTLYDSGNTHSQIEEAQALLKEERADAANNRINVANQIETSLLSLDAAHSSLTTADIGVSEAQAALAAAELGYQAGSETALDIADAQTNLLTAQTTAVNTKFDVASSQAQLSSAVGIFSGEGNTAYSRVLQEEAAAEKANASTAAPEKKHKKFLGIF